MKYISLFSGIGGFEALKVAPVMFCESDETSRNILSGMFPNSQPWDDVLTLNPERADIVVGGWPCQDLTVAGLMRGMKGKRSSLFFRMVEIARKAKAHTILGENVPHLLKIHKGRDFERILDTLVEEGFPFISWRTLNARAFGLPHERRRLFISASKHREVALSLHQQITSKYRFRASRARQVFSKATNGSAKPGSVSGLYWTGGVGRSLCLYEGYVPPLKVGSSTSKGTSPVAVFYNHTVRKLSPRECLLLQGFTSFRPFASLIGGDVFRMAGNAVARPVGQFVVDTAMFPRESSGVRVRFGVIEESGMLEDGVVWSVDHEPTHFSDNLDAFVDLDSEESLSPQAAAGFLTRIIRGNRRIPVALFDALYELSLTRTKLIGTKINSFEILHEKMDARGYRRDLLKAAGTS